MRLKHRSAFVLLASFLAARTHGQLILDPVPTVEELVQNVLAGNGVMISNITWSGDTSQFAYFNGSTCNIGLQSGLLMSTGTVLNALGPNDLGTTSSYFVDSTSADIDFDTMMTQDWQMAHDVARIEFDLIPAGDTLSVALVYASEEYLEFVGSFSDPMGLFLSGPDIDGPYSNGALNFALVPGDSGSVALNNNSLNDTQNGDLYVDNGNGSTAPNDSLPYYVQYDGFTIVLIFRHPVQSGSTYHLKIGVADAVDSSFDSALFLAAGSLTTDQIALGNHSDPESGTSIFVSPNPVMGVGQIMGLTGCGAYDLTVFDGFGHIVAQWETTSTHNRLEVSHLARGLFTLRATSTFGHVRHCKFMVD